MQINILLVGEAYSSNLGDGVICETVNSLIEDKFLGAKVDVLDLSFRRNFLKYDIQNKNDLQTPLSTKKVIFYKLLKLLYSNDLGEYALKKREIEKNKKELNNISLKKYDLCIFAGGSLFMDYFCVPIAKIIKIMEKNKVPVMFNACGISENKNIFFRWTMKNALQSSAVKSISLRDGYDDFIKRYKYKGKVDKTYDLAINCSSIYHVHRDYDSQIIGLGVMYIDKYEDDITAFWRKMVSYLETRNISYKIFCNGDIYDYNYIMNLKQQGIFKSELIEDRPVKPEELVKLIGTYKGIISFRMHSQIIATSMLIPSVAIVWNKKIIEFFRQIKREEYCYDIFSDIEIIVKTMIKATLDMKQINYLKKKSKENMLNNIEMILKDNQ